MTFSFTDQHKAEKALQLIKDYNQSQGTAFPVRGFVLPVEQFGY